ncbi:ADP-ribosylation factor-like protein 10 [Heterocephalus glaber]|uniref:ADP-ribosylation factor-like protein 10 n=1 Tax=Heterocephalus glaber TaxID=10181 RepID=G5ATJ8_HETGA|nr:ADP-ribosylation factor-like protein 10 [Heterocephalus glaber]
MAQRPLGPLMLELDGRGPAWLSALHPLESLLREWTGAVLGPREGLVGCRARLPPSVGKWDECEPEEDEEEEEPALEELEQREMLVLGLDGSGKSTPAFPVREDTAGRRRPHLGLQLRVAAHQRLRADQLWLPWARQELHKLLHKDPDLPVIIVANKQDLSEAMSVVELQQELGLQAEESQQEVFLLAASITPARSGFEEPGTVHIRKLLLELLSPRLRLPTLCLALVTTVPLPSALSPAWAQGRSHMVALPFCSPCLLKGKAENHTEAFLVRWP